METSHTSRVEYGSGKMESYSLPELTMETMMEVEVEELCTRTVTRIPIIRPTIGFRIYSFWNTEPVEIFIILSKGL